MFRPENSSLCKSASVATFVALNLPFSDILLVHYSECFPVTTHENIFPFAVSLMNLSCRAYLSVSARYQRVLKYVKIQDMLN